jgi:hypothetical protein
VVHLAAPMKNGGIVSRATRIPRYVVPQMTHTAAHDRYARVTETFECSLNRQARQTRYNVRLWARRKTGIML